MSQRIAKKWQWAGHITRRKMADWTEESFEVFVRFSRNIPEKLYNFRYLTSEISYVFNSNTVILRNVVT